MAQIATQLVWAEPGMLKFNEKSKVYCKKKQCKYCTNCPSAYLDVFWDARFHHKISNCIEKPMQIWHKLQINWFGWRQRCENSTEHKEVHWKTNAIIARVANKVIWAEFGMRQCNQKTRKYIERLIQILHLLQLRSCGRCLRPTTPTTHIHIYICCTWRLTTATTNRARDSAWRDGRTKPQDGDDSRITTSPMTAATRTKTHHQQEQ